MDIGLISCLNICGITAPQMVAMLREGYVSLKDFALNQYKDISKFAKLVQALPEARGGVIFGQVHIIKLKALLYWLKDKTRRGLAIIWQEFTHQELTLAAAAFTREEKRKDADAATVEVPTKFQPHTLRGWNTFNRELENYLASIRGTSGIPLVYVIRKLHNPTDPVPTNATQRLIWEAPLYGGDYELDRKTVYHIIRAATSDTDGWAWINDIKDENG